MEDGAFLSASLSNYVGDLQSRPEWEEKGWDVLSPVAPIEVAKQLGDRFEEGQTDTRAGCLAAEIKQRKARTPDSTHLRALLG